MRKRGETTQPRAAMRLVEEIGVTKASRQLGVSTTLLHKARKTHEITKSVELAAKAIVSRMREPEAGALAAIAGVPPEPEPAPHANGAHHEPVAKPEIKRALMLVEGSEKAIAALRHAAEFLGVKVEYDP
jgi:hypothetical protein